MEMFATHPSLTALILPIPPMLAASFHRGEIVQEFAWPEKQRVRTLPSHLPGKKGPTLPSRPRISPLAAVRNNAAYAVLSTATNRAAVDPVPPYRSREVS